MAATKEAVIAKEHHPELEIHIFLMDMRAFSKGYWDYYKRAKDQYGVQYHNCRISGISEEPRNNNLLLRYPDNSDSIESINIDSFDMVVLSVGMEIRDDEASRFSVSNLAYHLTRRDFGEIQDDSPLETNLPGVYAAGAFRGPKDIPESVIEASGAAEAVACFLAEVRNTETTIRDYPAEKDISCEPPRIGVCVSLRLKYCRLFRDVPRVTE